MVEDPQWRDSRFVCEDPHFRYYCGVPLRTENDINIGALFLLDDRPRESTNIARLKAQQTAEARRASSSHTSTEPPSRDDQTRGRTSHRSSSSEEAAKTKQKKSATEADHQRVFDRAAYLLRQASDLKQPGGGGVVLFDTNAQASSIDPLLKRQESDYARTGQSSRSSDSHGPAYPKPNSNETAYSGAMRERVVLAAASIQPADNKAAPKNIGRADPTFKVTLAPPELARMSKKHPRGKLFNIPDNCGTSLFDWEGRPIAGRLSAKMYDLVLLHRQFPEAKQVIFVPMFHVNLNRWTSCFVYSNSRFRALSYEMDYLPILAFCTAIKAEIVRLATVFADKQKSDFIGSVSHELRSPLHGILASIEFLQDTECDAFQRSCVDTMDACAQTLLDTSNESRERDSKQTNLPATTNIRSEPIFATDQDCDVALITEEVIDGLAIAHMAKYKTNAAFNDASREINPTLADAGVRPKLKRVLNAIRPGVELILDINGPPDWGFQTQPGAIRRIVMNLFGNSLKYTRHGHITVSLRVIGNQFCDGDQAVKFPQEQRSMVKLTVTDTGQGMSPEYLRTKIFTPFAQEDSKSAGTGLGLSIVRSLVTMLKGEIDIKSIVNVGTMVVVTLPMKRAATATSKPRTSSPDRLSESSSQAMRTRDSSVSALLSLDSPPQVAIYEPALEFDSFGQSQGAVSVHNALMQYLTQWYHFPALKTWDFDMPAKILVVDEIHLPTLLARRPDYLETVSLQSIIVLCASPSRQAILAQDIQSSQVEPICKPFGPFKLARAICRALERAAKAPTMGQYSEVPNTPSSGSSRALASRSRGRISIDYDDVSPIDRRARSPPLSPPEQQRPSLQKHNPALLSPALKPPKEVSPGPDRGYPFPVTHDNATPPTKTSTMPPLPSSQAKEARNNRPPYRDDKRNAAHPEHEQATSSASQKTLELMQQAANAPAVGGNARASETVSSTTGSTSPWNVPSFPKGRKPVVLIVDDNQLNLDLLQTYVTRKGYGAEIIKTAADGQEAVDAFNRYDPDIVFMDLSMPVMNGHEATRTIRQIESNRRASNEQVPTLNSLQEQSDSFSPATPMTPGSDGCVKSKKPALVVALTGNAKGSDQIEAFDSGVDIYMTKPVSFKQVGKLLENWREEQAEE
ncbi:hypothetical protein M409DRAFT_67433 [Zasmidium cellare ATCC 36951]|uniref:histidine kinase n=1 Tax=Zasmidium cellare ATCC 36951 TaxID=1080233 RepID=A0A6A6CD73_ZASCE|nr:uncharacterized protein M409DRAFT_67433 [Zasmidium cellare ATCC 36951]KAF2165157.1 hypothetical protein M409DRAFT_67433 [Zasmidium cellare ATCC 36951]